MKERPRKTANKYLKSQGQETAQEMLITDRLVIVTSLIGRLKIDTIGSF